MTDIADWYRSADPAPAIKPSLRRAVRDRVLSWLPQPKVRGKVMVLPSRQEFFTLSRTGASFHGLFSEFQSVLGALVYAERHGAAGVRVDFRSPLYVDEQRGPNWWTYFFEQDTMHIGARSSAAVEEVRLDSRVMKIGRYGGFADVIPGATPYLYPMTCGVSRADLHQRLSTHIFIRREILDAVESIVKRDFEAGAYVVGVHYRGTDATRGWSGALTHYRTTPLPYRVYAEEVRRILDRESPRRYQVFVATDEIEFLEFMGREFGNRIVQFDEAPRAHAGGEAIHYDTTLPVSNYHKGRSAVIDCLLLAASSYLVKGRSNLSDASLVFNPSLPFSFCPDVAVAAMTVRDPVAVSRRPGRGDQTRVDSA
jgi:hypothetical protein